MSRGRYGYHDVPRSASDHGPFEMTRRDADRVPDRDASLYASMRDAYNYLNRDRGSRHTLGSRDLGVGRDVGSAIESAFGKTANVGGVLAGAGIAGLMAGLLGNANLGSTGIPNAIVPAAAFGAAAYTGVLPFFSKETWQSAALGALGMGAGLWLLSQGLRVQSARTAQAPAVVVAGQPPKTVARDYLRGPAIGGAPPYLAAAGYPQVGYPQVGRGSASLSPLSEAEMISIAARY